MSVALKSPVDNEPPLTDASARERLAKSIADHAQRMTRVEAIRAAQANLQPRRFAARRAVEAATEAVRRAKQLTAQHLAERALGHAATPPITQKQARQKLLEAEEHLDELMIATDALAQRLATASESTVYSRMNLDRAKQDVLAASPAVADFVARYQKAHAGVVSMRRVLSWLFDRGVLAADWSNESEFQDLGLLSSWEAAWVALESDANAKLPE